MKLQIALLLSCLVCNCAIVSAEETAKPKAEPTEQEKHPEEAIDKLKNEGDGPQTIKVKGLEADAWLVKTIEVQDTPLADDRVNSAPFALKIDPKWNASALYYVVDSLEEGAYIFSVSARSETKETPKRDLPKALQIPAIIEVFHGVQCRGLTQLPQKEYGNLVIQYFTSIIPQFTDHAARKFKLRIFAVKQH